MAWEQLKSIADEIYQEYVAAQNRPPEACPNDGEPLQLVRGTYWCPFDGYVWHR